MQDNIINKFWIVLIPWNIQLNFYVKVSKSGNYTLSNWLFEDIINNEKDFTVINNKIKKILEKYKKKWFNLSKKVKKLNIEDLNKLFKIKFWIKGATQDIMKLEWQKYDYYIMDTPRIVNGERQVDRNVIFFTKNLNEYIWRFILNKIDNNSLSIWSIFITPSKQRLWHFTNVLIYDIKDMLELNVNELYAFNILKKWLWFYLKLEKENKFEFLDSKKTSWKFLLNNF